MIRPAASVYLYRVSYISAIGKSPLKTAIIVVRSHSKHVICVVHICCSGGAGFPSNLTVVLCLKTGEDVNVEPQYSHSIIISCAPFFSSPVVCTRTTVFDSKVILERHPLGDISESRPCFCGAITKVF